MNSKIAIKVENLSKRYRIGLKEEIHDSVGGAIFSWVKSPIYNFKKLKKLSTFNDNESEDIIWALKDVSFEVKAGEVLGIIGKNGAGKSTLLKILSKITEPTSGKVEINGRVASLLEVGTGFHGELTGRENVYLNGTILGMTKKEVDQKFDEIVDFSGVEKFIDTPVKRYSSGMTVRLAFAVAAHLDPEILIIDEVLAVGDAEFQQKCLGKMKDVAEYGRTILFVSHNMGAVKSLCESIVYLENGGICQIGKTYEIIRNYLNRNLEKGKTLLSKDEIEKKLAGIILKNEPTIRFQHISIKDQNGELKNKFSSDEPITIEIGLKLYIKLRDIGIVLYLVNEHDEQFLATQFCDDYVYLNMIGEFNKGEYCAKCTIPANLLASKDYYLTIVLFNPKIEHLTLSKVMSFSVMFKGYNNIQDGSNENVYFRPRFNWTLEQLKTAEVVK